MNDLGTLPVSIFSRKYTLLIIKSRTYMQNDCNMSFEARKKNVLFVFVSIKFSFTSFPHLNLKQFCT